MTDRKAFIVAIIAVSLLAISVGAFLQIADIDLYQLLGDG